MRERAATHFLAVPRAAAGQIAAVPCNQHAGSTPPDVTLYETVYSALIWNRRSTKAKLVIDMHLGWLHDIQMLPFYALYKSHFLTKRYRT